MGGCDSGMVHGELVQKFPSRRRATALEAMAGRIRMKGAVEGEVEIAFETSSGSLKAEMF
jgi:hypothetical protein